MPKMSTSGDAPIQLHYTDTGGEGRPLVLIHGWPLSGESFRVNEKSFTAAGLRVITYDRRGFGQSDKPADGYHYDRLASDLDDLMGLLDLRDAVILGFSMGGGEVARYCSRYGTGRLSGVILSGSICPALCQTEDNPDGAMPMSAFQEMADACRADHQGFLGQFITSFFSNNDGLAVDDDTRGEALSIAMQSDRNAAAESILAWATDLRSDCERIHVPALVIHGDGDQNVPPAASSERAARLIPNARLHMIAGGTHGSNISHQAEWEKAVTDFIADL
mgnify:CR=1 FL=1